MNDQTSAQPESTAQQRSPALARGLGWILNIVMKLIIVGFFLAGGLLVGGFLQFSNTVMSSQAPQSVEAVEGIVALTGGSNRVAKALELMADNKGERVLITGVNEVVKMRQLRAMNKKRSALFDCCVDLERQALDTVGNAVETRKWMTARGYNSLLLVTSGYHMPRSLLEFRREMPEARIIPYPVELRQLNDEKWWTEPETLRLMISEYLKYVGAQARGYLAPKTLDALRAAMNGS